MGLGQAIIRNISSQQFQCRYCHGLAVAHIGCIKKRGSTRLERNIISAHHADKRARSADRCTARAVIHLITDRKSINRQRLRCNGQISAQPANGIITIGNAATLNSIGSHGLTHRAGHGARKDIPDHKTAATIGCFSPITQRRIRLSIDLGRCISR